MSMTQNHVGVDIAKDWIDSFDPQTGKSRRIKATPQALKAFSQHCTGRIVVFEASGGYERPLLEALQAAGIAFTRINPRHAREFARATGRLAKTDRVDAEGLARMGAALALQPDPPRDEAADRLAMLVARREALVEHRKQERQRRQQVADAFIAKDIASLVTVLTRRIGKVEAEIAEQIKTHDHLARRNRQLRALYTAAFIASRHDPGLKAYRQKLDDAGKPFKVAIIAVARRLLTQINAMIRQGRYYDTRPA